MVLLFIIIPLASQVCITRFFNVADNIFLTDETQSFSFFFLIEMSLAVPITNSLTFIFSLLTGLLLGEDLGGKGKNTE